MFTIFLRENFYGQKKFFTNAIFRRQAPSHQKNGDEIIISFNISDVG